MTENTRISQHSQFLRASPSPSPMETASEATQSTRGKSGHLSVSLHRTDSSSSLPGTNAAAGIFKNAVNGPQTESGPVGKQDLKESFKTDNVNVKAARKTSNVANAAKFLKKNISDLGKAARASMHLSNDHRQRSHSATSPVTPPSPNSVKKQEDFVANSSRRPRSNAIMGNRPETQKTEAPTEKEKTAVATEKIQTPENASKQDRELGKSMHQIGYEFANTTLNFIGQTDSMKNGFTGLKEHLSTLSNEKKLQGAFSKTAVGEVESWINKLTQFSSNIQGTRDSLTELKGRLDVTHESTQNFLESDLKQLTKATSKEYKTFIREMGNELPKWLKFVDFLDQNNIKLSDFGLKDFNFIIFIQKLPRETLLLKELMKNAPEDLKNLLSELLKMTHEVTDKLNKDIEFKDSIKAALENQNSHKPYINLLSQITARDNEKEKEKIGEQIFQLQTLANENKSIVATLKKGFGSSVLNRSEIKTIESQDQLITKKLEELNKALSTLSKTEEAA